MRDAIAQRLARLQGAYDDRDRLLAQVLGVGRTDLRCLDLLVRTGGQSPSQLAQALHLTRGSVTTMVARLADQGYVRQTDSPDEGRRKLVHATQHVQLRVAEVYGDHLERSSTYLDNFTDAELSTVLRFLDATLTLQDGVLADLAIHASRPPANDADCDAARAAHPRAPTEGRRT